MASDIIALPSLNWCLSCEWIDLVGVFAQPDRPTGRGKKLVANPIKAWAEENGIQVRQPEKLTVDDAEWVRAQDVDFSIVMAYGQFLKRDILSAPKVDTVNLHGSILPAYRGACPVEASILNGDAVAGVSLMKVVKKMDAGPVYDCERVEVDEGVVGPELREQVGGVCPQLLERALPLIFSGELGPKDQDESAVSYVRRLFKTDAFLDFREPANALERRSRALFPWPGSAIKVGEDTLKVADLKVVENLEQAAAVGTLLETPRGIGIQCSEGVLVPQKWQRPGGKMLNALDFFRGYALVPGTIIESADHPPIITPEPFKYH